MELFGFGDEAAGEELFVGVGELVEVDVGEAVVDGFVEVDVAVGAPAETAGAGLGGGGDEDLRAGANRGGARAGAGGDFFLGEVELDALGRAAGAVRTGAVSVGPAECLSQAAWLCMGIGSRSFPRPRPPYNVRGIGLSFPLPQAQPIQHCMRLGL